MNSHTSKDYKWPRKTILIAEDEIINYRLLYIMLSKTGAAILHAANGLKTLEIFNETPQIDLILLDVKMPEMDGYEVTCEIRKKNKIVPIIAQTAYAVDEEKERLIKAGCNAFITKPINKNELFSIINYYLEE